MAVKLIRTDPSLETAEDNSTLPIIEIKNKGISAPDYLEGKVTSRTNFVFTSDGQQRDTVRQDNFTRRQSQLSEGGFHGTPGHKYTEIGEVVLDDSTLILQALGQDKKHLARTTDFALENMEKASGGGGRGVLPPLRSRTLSQFPDQLKSLHLELFHSSAHLHKVRKGQGLFHLMKQEAEQEQQHTDMKAKLEEEQNRLEWKEAAKSDSTHELALSTEGVEVEEDGDSEIQHMHRFLRAILWILECMKLESPQYMPALGTYWRITRPQIVNGKRIYERQHAMLNKWEEMILQKTAAHKQQKIEIRRANSAFTLAQKQKIEMEKLRKQKTLTPDQFEKLKILVEEELNRSKKNARMKIKELMEESAQKYRRQKKSSEKKKTMSSVGLDVEQSKLLFGKVDESRGMIIHEQLTVMSRDRQDALEQRFSSLTVSEGLWKDISNMRSGVEIETTAMAHNKLMMNYNWISDLKEMLPDAVLSNRYCRITLGHLCSLQEHMKSVGPVVMSQEKLILVLSTLYPWQLDSPEVTKAVEFIIKSVIYIVPEDYQKWVEYNSKQK